MSSSSRNLLCLLVVVCCTLAVVATPRPAPLTTSIPVEVSAGRTGAPQTETMPSMGPSPRASGAPTPRPSGGIDKGFYCSEPTCGYVEPAAKPKPQTPPSRALSGTATWWYSFGPGLYAAIRPDLGSKGDLAIVCGPVAHTPNGTSSRAATSRDRARETPLLTLPTVRGSRDVAGGLVPFHCLTVPITTTCACLGPNSDRLIDLSRDAFASFADPSRGVVKIVLQVVRD